MSRAEHISRLSELELFSGCSKKDLQHIARASDEIEVPAGTVLMEQGAVGQDAYVILEGEAVVRRGGRKIATVGPGDSIGELALLDHGPRTAYVEATTDMRLLHLTSRAFKGLLAETPALSLKLLGALASRVRDLDRKIYG